jgi:hypothetical protein
MEIARLGYLLPLLQEVLRYSSVINQADIKSIGASYVKTYRSG